MKLINYLRRPRETKNGFPLPSAMFYICIVVIIFCEVARRLWV